MEKTNWKNFWDQLVAATIKKWNAQLLFSSCKYIQEVKLRVKEQMGLSHLQIYTRSKILNFIISIRLFLLDTLTLWQKRFLKKTFHYN